MAHAGRGDAYAHVPGTKWWQVDFSHFRGGIGCGDDNGLDHEGLLASRYGISELDRLDLEELVHAEAAHLAADTGLLVAAERGERVVDAAVDVDLAGPDPPPEGPGAGPGRPTTPSRAVRTGSCWRWPAPRPHRRRGSPRALARRSPPGRGWNQG